MTREQFEADVRQALEECRPALDGAKATVHFEDRVGWLDPTEVDATDPAVEACLVAAFQVLGKRPPLAYFPGGTDAYAFQAVGNIPTVAAFGPGRLPLAHGPNEWVSVTSLRQAASMYALLALAFGDAGDQN